MKWSAPAVLLRSGRVPWHIAVHLVFVVCGCNCVAVSVARLAGLLCQDCYVRLVMSGLLCEACCARLVMSGLLDRLLCQDCYVGIIMSGLLCEAYYVRLLM